MSESFSDIINLGPAIKDAESLSSALKNVGVVVGKDSKEFKTLAKAMDNAFDEKVVKDFASKAGVSLDQLKRYLKQTNQNVSSLTANIRVAKGAINDYSDSINALARAGEGKEAKVLFDKANIVALEEYAERKKQIELLDKKLMYERLFEEAAARDEFYAKKRDLALKNFKFEEELIHRRREEDIKAAFEADDAKKKIAAFEAKRDRDLIALRKELVTKNESAQEAKRIKNIADRTTHLKYLHEEYKKGARSLRYMTEAERNYVIEAEQAAKATAKSGLSLKNWVMHAERLIRYFTLTTLAFSAFREITSSIKIGAQFEQSIKTAAGVMGIIGEEGEKQFGRLEDAARKAGETTEWTATQAAEGLLYLGKAGLNATQSILSLPTVVDLATAATIDLGRAADIATNALTAMQLDVSDLDKVASTFVKTTTTANVNMEEMSEAFEQSALVANNYGYSISQLSAMIGILGDAGTKGGKAGTQLARAFLKTRDVFEYYGVALKDETGRTRDLVDAVELLNKVGADANKIQSIFGDRAQKAVTALLNARKAGKTGAEAVREYTKQIEEADDAHKELAATMRNTTMGAWKEFISVVESIKIDIFDQYRDGLRDVLRGATMFLREHRDGIESVIAIMVKLVRAAKDLGILLATMWAINKISPYIIFLKQVSKYTSVLKFSVYELIGAYQALNVVQKANIAILVGFAIYEGVRLIRERIKATEDLAEAERVRAEKSKKEHQEELARLKEIDASSRKYDLTEAIKKAEIELEGLNAAHDKITEKYKKGRYLLGSSYLRDSGAAAKKVREAEARLNDLKTALAQTEDELEKIKKKNDENVADMYDYDQNKKMIDYYDRVLGDEKALKEAIDQRTKLYKEQPGVDAAEQAKRADFLAMNREEKLLAFKEETTKKAMALAEKLANYEITQGEYASLSEEQRAVQKMIIIWDYYKKIYKLQDKYHKDSVKLGDKYRKDQIAEEKKLREEARKLIEQRMKDLMKQKNPAISYVWERDKLNEEFKLMMGELNKQTSEFQAKVRSIHAFQKNSGSLGYISALDISNLEKEIEDIEELRKALLQITDILKAQSELREKEGERQTRLSSLDKKFAEETIEMDQETLTYVDKKRKLLEDQKKIKEADIKLNKITKEQFEAEYELAFTLLDIEEKRLRLAKDKRNIDRKTSDKIFALDIDAMGYTKNDDRYWSIQKKKAKEQFTADMKYLNQKESAAGEYWKAWKKYVDAIRDVEKDSLEYRAQKWKDLQTSMAQTLGSMISMLGQGASITQVITAGLSSAGRNIGNYLSGDVGDFLVKTLGIGEKLGSSLGSALGGPIGEVMGLAIGKVLENLTAPTEAGKKTAELIKALENLADRIKEFDDNLSFKLELAGKTPTQKLGIYKQLVTDTAAAKSAYDEFRSGEGNTTWEDLNFLQQLVSYIDGASKKYKENSEKLLTLIETYEKLSTQLNSLKEELINLGVEAKGAAIQLVSTREEFYDQRSRRAWGMAEWSNQMGLDKQSVNELIAAYDTAVDTYGETSVNTAVAQIQLTEALTDLWETEQSLLNSYDEMISTNEALIDSNNSLRTSLLEGELNPNQTFAWARSHYEELLAKATAANATSKDIEAYQNYVQAYLEKAKEMYGSTDEYERIFNQVLNTDLPDIETALVESNKALTEAINGLKDSVDAAYTGGAGMAGGGILSGPSSGYLTKTVFHGDEAVIPLKNGAVPVSLYGTDMGNAQIESLLVELITAVREGQIVINGNEWSNTVRKIADDNRVNAETHNMTGQRMVL